MALDEEAMQGRVYVHKKCGGETRIAEGDFMEICNPMCFVPLRGTLCVVCNAPDKLTEFEWADTSETLTDFRTRMSALVSPFWRTLMAWAWIPAGLIIGGAIGAIVASEKGHAGACFLAGAFGGILLLWQLLDANTVAAWLKLKFHHQK